MGVRRARSPFAPLLSADVVPVHLLQAGLGRDPLSSATDTNLAWPGWAQTSTPAQSSPSAATEWQAQHKAYRSFGGQGQSDEELPVHCSGGIY